MSLKRLRTALIALRTRRDRLRTIADGLSRVRESLSAHHDRVRRRPRSLSGSLRAPSRHGLGTALRQEPAAHRP